MSTDPTARHDHGSRLSAQGLDALRYASQRQLTRWSTRELSPRDVQRRNALRDALSALAPLKHCDCELRPLTSDDTPQADLPRRTCGRGSARHPQSLGMP